tara:strand:+ start:1961 stop:2839 length:879 start_codon:yes stop_codon:yes gene_type:complete
MREKDLKENGLADMAYKVERDHEVQMARGDLYKIAKYGIKLHEMLKGVSEEQGLEGWVQAKITKAADYLSSVYHHLDYEMKFDEVSESKKADKFEPHMMYKDGKSKKANTEKDHLDLAKKGWSHDNPKTKKVEEAEDKKPKEKMQISKADEKNNTPAFQRWRAGDERYEYKDKTQPRKSNESYADYLQSKLEEAKANESLYDNIHKNRKAGKKPRKKGAKGAPTKKDWENAAKTAKESVDANCPDCGNPSYTTLPEEKQKGVDGKVCWKGYKIGNPRTKKKGGKTVDNCVKM